MNENNTKVVRHDFSIENILSKPDKSENSEHLLHARIPIQVEIKSDRLSMQLELTENESEERSEEHLLISDKTFDNKSHNSFATPDSSCCGEENSEILSDITSEESCKSINKKF